MNSSLSLNFKDYTTWAGLFGFASTIAFAIPHPVAHTVGQICAALATAIMTAFTNKTVSADQSATPEELLKEGRK